MADLVLFAAASYALGWLAALAFFARMQGPVPVPGRWRRDAREALLWPVWLPLYAMLWLIARLPQKFDAELPRD